MQAGCASCKMRCPRTDATLCPCCSLRIPLALGCRLMQAVLVEACVHFYVSPSHRCSVLCSRLLHCRHLALLLPPLLLQLLLLLLPALCSARPKLGRARPMSAEIGSTSVASGLNLVGRAKLVQSSANARRTRPGFGRIRSRIWSTWADTVSTVAEVIPNRSKSLRIRPHPGQISLADA